MSGAAGYGKHPARGHLATRWSSCADLIWVTLEKASMSGTPQAADVKRP